MPLIHRNSSFMLVVIMSLQVVNQRKRRERQDQKSHKQHFRIDIMVSTGDDLEIRTSGRKGHNEALRQTGDRCGTDKRKVYFTKPQVPGNKIPVYGI